MQRAKNMEPSFTLLGCWCCFCWIYIFLILCLLLEFSLFVISLLPCFFFKEFSQCTRKKLPKFDGKCFLSSSLPLVCHIWSKKRRIRNVGNRLSCYLTILHSFVGSFIHSYPLTYVMYYYCYDYFVSCTVLYIRHFVEIVHVLYDKGRDENIIFTFFTLFLSLAMDVPGAKFMPNYIPSGR